MRAQWVPIVAFLLLSLAWHSPVPESVAQENPAGRAEAYSLLGKPLYPYPAAPEVQAKREQELASARRRFEAAPTEENFIWLGRRTAYLMRYREAIRIFTRGLEKFPRSYKLLRHRGHRYISIRAFDKAVADLEKASRLIASVPDEVEPDGLPNRYNIPTSTSHTNIWYHLGLAYYLKGEYENAVRAYRECLKFCKNDDITVATLDWLYMALRRLGRKKEAAELLAPVIEQMKILENHAYHSRLLMYKGLKTPETLLAPETSDEIQLATYGYGVANWYDYNGDRKRAAEIYTKIIAGRGWPAFGYIAAEADLARMGGK